MTVRWFDNKRGVALVLSLVFTVVLFAGVVVWGIHTLAERTDNNCVRIHQLVRTLDTILASGDAQTRKYVSEGLLTPDQAHRADVYRARQRKVLSTADCVP